jgi:predicted Fe-Mo cluster-binding NifX family protein
MAVLKAGGIEVFQAQAGMNVEQAIAAYQAGQLQQIQNANVQGHWV